MNYTQEQIDAFVLEARDRERARCAGIAEQEPWPEGPPPAEVLEASKGLRYEQIVEAAVKATRESIALDPWPDLELFE